MRRPVPWHGRLRVCSLEAQTAQVKPAALAMNLLESHDATCPHCWETITVTLDLSVPEQSYIEDCPVCCKPMIVAYSAHEGELQDLRVEATD